MSRLVLYVDSLSIYIYNEYACVLFIRQFISVLPASRAKFEIIPPNYYVLSHYDNPIVLNCTVSYMHACEPRIHANVYYIHSRTLNLSVDFNISPPLERSALITMHLNEPSCGTF